MDDGSNTVELCNATTETIIQQKSRWGNETNEALGSAVHHLLMAMYLEPFKLNPIKELMGLNIEGLLEEEDVETMDVRAMHQNKEAKISKGSQGTFKLALI